MQNTFDARMVLQEACHLQSVLHVLAHADRQSLDSSHQQVTLERRRHCADNFKQKGKFNTLYNITIPICLGSDCADVLLQGSIHSSFCLLMENLCTVYIYIYGNLRVWISRRRWCKPSSLVTSTPISTSEWPLRYLVAEFMTISAPNSSGLCQESR